MNYRFATIFGLFLTFFALWLQTNPSPFIHNAIDGLDSFGYDLQLKAYTIRKQPTPSNAIAIVDIDDKSLRAEGRWPWSRAKLAELVIEMEKLGAAVIAFDMFFSETQPNVVDELIKKISYQPGSAEVVKLLKPYQTEFNEDLVFAKALTSSTVVLAITFLPTEQKQNILPPALLKISDEESSEFNLYKAKGYITSIPVIQDAAQKRVGFINIFADNDGIFRHVPLFIEYNNDLYPSLALQAVQSFIGADVKLITPKYGGRRELEGVQIGSTTIPIDINGQALIPFIGKSFTFPYISATDILHHRVPQNALVGKIVFVGTSATGLGDLKATAIQNPFPGVEVQASVANGILENDFSYRPAWTYGANLFLTFVLGIAVAFVFPRLGARALGAVIILLPLILLLINNWIWEKTGLVLSFLVPVTLVLTSAIFNMIYGYLFESRRRERIKQMFGQYVPSQHIDQMLKSSGSYGLGGENREMSVLFADIRNFTSISEELTATQLVEILNAFFTPMTEIIFRNHGTIDKYVGDLIMAFWGAPLKNKNHAHDAILAALSMQERMEKLTIEFKEKNWPSLQIGIGVNSGVMSVGDMGSKYRRNYTVLGDNVNLASRVESLTKFYGCHIIITGDTRKDQTKFIFRLLDRVRVKGKQRGIDIYDVLGRIEQLTPELEKELADYHEALNAYFNREFSQALTMIEKLQKTYPDKKIYKIYLDRLRIYAQHPLPPDWDGVYIHQSK